VMETRAKPFNVDFHDALMQVPRADVPSHTVVEEVEKGYLLFDKVIRHAKVIVSADMPSEEEKKD
jgi:molecular chaperone GrpE